jgi:hypothetical protein
MQGFKYADELLNFHAKNSCTIYNVLVYYAKINNL